MIRACVKKSKHARGEREREREMAESSGEMSLNLNLSTSAPKKRREPEEDHGEERQKNKKRRRDEDGEGGGGEHHKGNEAYISSLFNHNPEIPRMDLTAVNPVHEEIFTAQSFGDVGIHPYLVKNLVDFKITEMTQVQMKSIPYVLAGKDALIKSQTGSGKTLAYAIPILQKLQEIRPEIQRTDGTFAVIIVPTRELAIQSFEWFDKLCRSFARIVPGMLIGGEKKKSEKARVRKGINILISTPGRLIDHIQHTECLSLKKLKFLVLDEADRMLELGYERDVQTILTAINETSDESCPRQTLLLSATLTSGIEQLSEISMKHPKFIDAAVGEENSEESLKTLTTPENLKQTFIIAPAKLRLVTLAAFILWKCRYSKSRKVLIFMSTQVGYEVFLVGNPPRLMRRNLVIVN